MTVVPNISCFHSVGLVLISIELSSVSGGTCLKRRMRQSGRSDFQQVILESAKGLGHWAIINGHSLAGTGRFPTGRDQRNRMKAEIFTNHVRYGLVLLETLADTQSKNKGTARFHDCALTVGGDFNMTLAETQSALNFELHGDGHQGL